jgi:hypothetical protein
LERTQRKKTEFLKRYLAASQSLACSLDRIKTADNARTPRKGKD